MQCRHAETTDQNHAARTPEGRQNPAIGEASRTVDPSQATAGRLHHPDSGDTTWLPGEGGYEESLQRRHAAWDARPDKGQATREVRESTLPQQAGPNPANGNSKLPDNQKEERQPTRGSQ
eukprot:9091975-Prorocentrum_lima.AAC.1